MSVKIETKTIDIIYPGTMGEAIPESLIFCQEFINKLIELNIDWIKIKINSNLKLVECNNSEIKNYVDLLLKSGKIDCFYKQFVALLHSKNGELGNNGILICYVHGQEINFGMKEKKLCQDFSWDIEKRLI